MSATNESMQMFKIDYEKRKNTELFTAFQSEKLTYLSEIQNYIPIYSQFFALNETNYNSINLNHKWYITDVKKTEKEEEENKNVFRCNIKSLHNTTGKSKKKNVFFKMAPLLDPFKFLIGKYDVNDPSLFTLPKYNTNNNNTNINDYTKPHIKITEQNNSAYVDGFFSFLTSILIHNHEFIHGVDYYGSFLAIKNNFKLNVSDDIEYLCKSEYFIKNKNILFQVEDYEYLLNNGGGDEHLKPLIPLKIDHNCSNKSKLSIKSIDVDMFEDLFIDEHNIIESTNLTLTNVQDHNLNQIIESEDMIDIMDTIQYSKLTHSTTIKSNSTCSSRTSHTSNESLLEHECLDCIDLHDDDDNDDDNDDKNNTDGVTNNNKNEEENKTNREKNKNDEKDEDNWTDISDGDEDNSSGSRSSFEEQRIDATLPKFPVQVICMEYCENTFDDLIMNEDLTQEEWFSAFMQIIMTLITYQKAFAFTHNDLHTNNVMYNMTDKKFVYYCYKKKYYKVPTFGRIFKIIDFGRGIYKFNGKLFCSDSFQVGEDASTQYNTEPFMNEDKPRLDPNYSFDLCRLACSIFDYMVDDLDEIIDLSKCAPEIRLIVEWCLDDSGTNILYKTNGSERYPDFKLYKMIARCVHKHTPHAQLDRPEFKEYIINKSEVSKTESIINIDNISSYIAPIPL